MVNLLITAGIISLVSAIIGALIALKIQSRALKRIGIEHEGWQHAQESHHQTWEVQQRKQAFDLEKKLTGQVQQIQDAWQRWRAYDEERLARLTLEQKLSHLPLIEDLPVSPDERSQTEHTNLSEQLRQPPSFYRADLSGRDLSQRYLAHADLREAQLVNTNFYMADLTGACLTGANLAGANLAGANLTGADLRYAVLTDANVLVADLNGAILNGANLLGAHNLTTEQIHSAIYDSKTQTSIESGGNLPRVANVHLTDLKPTTPPASLASDNSIPISRKTGRRRAKA